MQPRVARDSRAVCKKGNVWCMTKLPPYHAARSITAFDELAGLICQ